ncbi:hypothetical protein M422DRAFT_247299 [Sphaerobolus stellatus SS14]|nr:hypothetical protein M422DRAFT_247299 [Sphaerobolus stellatus SS14]
MPPILSNPSSLATAHIKSTPTTAPLTRHRHRTMTCVAVVIQAKSKRCANVLSAKFRDKGKAKEEDIVAVVGDRDVVAKELHEKRRHLSPFTAPQDELPQFGVVANGGSEGSNEGSEPDGIIEAAVARHGSREPYIKIEEESVSLLISVTTESVAPNVNGERMPSMKSMRTRTLCLNTTHLNRMLWMSDFKSESDSDSGFYYSPQPVSTSDCSSDSASDSASDSESDEQSASVISTVSSMHISSYESANAIETDGSAAFVEFAL